MTITIVVSVVVIMTTIFILTQLKPFILTVAFGVPFFYLQTGRLTTTTLPQMVAWKVFRILLCGDGLFNGFFVFGFLI